MIEMLLDRLLQGCSHPVIRPRRRLLQPRPDCFAPLQATIVLHRGPDTRVQVLPGLVLVPQAPVEHPRWGLYKQRGEAMGIPIMAFDCVSQVGCPAW